MAADTTAHDADLVEREREVQALEGALARALAGEGRAVLIEGPAGIGKSRLLAALRRRGEAAGALTLAARSSELEREFPFGVVRQLFEAQLADPEASERALSGAAAPARSVFASLDPAPGADGDASFATLHGLYWLLLNLAGERPLVLAVDDLHWCDRPSLRFLAYLTRRLEGLPVLLAVTTRSTEPGTDPVLVSEIAGDQITAPVRPGPLTRDAVRGLVRAELGADAADPFSDAVAAATGGNPLLVRQLLRALEAEGVRPDASSAGLVREIGPSAVARTVLLRLARLPAETLAVARAVAVLGEHAAEQAVATLAGVDDTELAAAGAALARAEILRPEPPLAFVPVVVPAGISGQPPPAAGALCHARAAAILRAQGAPVNQVAAQLLNVPPHGDADVAALLHDAGRAAFARGASDSAVGLLARALEEPPPPDRHAAVLLDLALAETLVDGTRAVAHLKEAYALISHPVAKAQLAAVLTQILTFTGSPNESYDLAQEVLATLPDGMQDVRRRLEAQMAVSLQWGSGLLDEIAFLDAYRSGIDEPGAGARMVEIVAALRLVYRCEPVAQCLPLVDRACADGTLVEEDDGLFTVVAVLIYATADTERAIALADEILARAHRKGSAFGVLGVALWRGYALLRRGELVDAVASFEEAVRELAAWHGAAGGDVYAAAMLGLALLERGELEAARRTLDPALRGQFWTSLEAARWWNGSECEVLLAAGEPERVLEIAEELRVEHPHVDNVTVHSWRSPRARALHALGRTEEAIPLLEENVVLARRWGAPSAVGRTLRELGEIKGEAGLPELEAAVEALEGSTARLELAKALAALGRTLRHARRPADARDPLRRALELADACGAAGLAEDVRAELHAAGARPRTAALTGAGALTASERRVAGLAAEGSSNRDIAQTLYVTPKTVEVHLSNAYRKLGIRSRRELAGALVES